MTTETLPCLITAATIAACTGPKPTNERLSEIIADDSEEPEKRRLAQEVIDSRQTISLAGLDGAVMNLSDWDDGAGVVDPHSVRR